MGKETVHDFRSLKHKTLAEMAEEAIGGKAVAVDKKIAVDAAQQGHDGFVPATTVQGRNGKSEVRGQQNPATQRGLRGRFAMFLPTKERVTVIRERVGQNYSGVWVHEVTSREGQNFLAAETQLGEYVQPNVTIPD